MHEANIQNTSYTRPFGNAYNNADISYSPGENESGGGDGKSGENEPGDNGGKPGGGNNPGGGGNPVNENPVPVGHGEKVPSGKLPAGKAESQRDVRSKIDRGAGVTSRPAPAAAGQEGVQRETATVTAIPDPSTQESAPAQDTLENAPAQNAPESAPTTSIEDKATPLGVPGNEEEWPLLNLVFTLAGVAFAALAVRRYFSGSDDRQQEQNLEGTEARIRREARRATATTASVCTAVLGAVIWFLTQDIAGRMTLTDGYTALQGAVAAAAAICAILPRRVSRGTDV
jgi:hypothetical protein